MSCVKFLFSSFELIYSFRPQQLNKLVTLLIQCVQLDTFKIRTQSAYRNLLSMVGSCSVGLFYYITTI